MCTVAAAQGDAVLARERADKAACIFWTGGMGWHYSVFYLWSGRLPSAGIYVFMYQKILTGPLWHTALVLTQVQGGLSQRRSRAQYQSAWPWPHGTTRWGVGELIQVKEVRVGVTVPSYGQKSLTLPRNPLVYLCTTT